ncbi:MAG: glycosyltransferase family 4 protein [bacterium]|nr:glycosyltransferase family 4 protein [bacterium]
MTLKKQILYITRPIGPPWNEGSKNFIFNLVQYIARYDYVINLPTADNNISIDNLHCCYFPNADKLTLGVKIKLFWLLVTTKATIVHLLFVPTTFTSIFIKIIYGIKKFKIVQTISSLEKHTDKYIHNNIYGDQIICFSHSTAKILQEHAVSNINVIPPGVKIPDYDISKKEKRIAFLGELYRMESYQMLIEIIDILRHKLPAYSIYLGIRTSTKPIQEKQLKNKLKNRYRDDDKIRIIGDIPNINKFLAKTKLVIVPAKKTSGKFDLPLVLIESLASGTPIVISPIKPMSEISPYSQQAIKNNSPANFAMRIIEILSSNYTQKSKQSYLYAKKHYDIRKVSKQHIKVYEKLT